MPRAEQAEEVSIEIGLQQAIRFVDRQYGEWFWRVRRDGSVDWLCVPRFDSDACFAALLGGPEHGRWLLGPATPARRIRRAYRPGTLVLETEHEADGGLLRVTDFMPPRDQDPNLVRIAECVEGSVRVRMELSPRFEYGRVRPWITRRDDGEALVSGPDALRLRTPVPISAHGNDLRADVTLRRGERALFTLVWHASYAASPRVIDPFAALEDCDRWWREWSARCTYDGPWRDAVVRGGDRVYVAQSGERVPMSLTGTCLRCHKEPDKFCNKCHAYAGVEAFCWDCHQQKKRSSP